MVESICTVDVAKSITFAVVIVLGIAVVAEALVCGDVGTGNNRLFINTCTINNFTSKIVAISKLCQNTYFINFE